MPERGVFCFQVNEVTFPVAQTPELMKHLKQLADKTVEVQLWGSGTAASLPSDVALEVFRNLWSGEDPMTAFLHRAAVESQKRTMAT